MFISTVFVHKLSARDFISTTVLTNAKNHFCKKKQRNDDKIINSKTTAVAKYVNIFGQMVCLDRELRFPYRSLFTCESMLLLAC